LRSGWGGRGQKRTRRRGEGRGQGRRTRVERLGFPVELDGDVSSKSGERIEKVRLRTRMM